MTNFVFLKTIDKDLFEIITESEKLYRDEYFEQCITQTRRFGEIICKNVLGNYRTTEKTFDDMLATLKDKTSTIIQEKEFIDDLYFLKREGNASVHATSLKKNGILALECLQRAFEISIYYAVYFKKSDAKLLKLNYDTELLLTGKKTKKTLTEKYLEAKNKNTKNTDKKSITKKKTKKTNLSKKKKVPLFLIFIILSTIISSVLVLTIFLLSFIS